MAVHQEAVIFSIQLAIELLFIVVDGVPRVRCGPPNLAYDKLGRGIEFGPCVK